MTGAEFKPPVERLECFDYEKMFGHKYQKRYIRLYGKCYKCLYYSMLKKKGKK